MPAALIARSSKVGGLVCGWLVAGWLKSWIEGWFDGGLVGW